ncbi:MAG: DUF4864 domain-containing protein [Betaproteobacteria bacterium]|nr:DUF4864 domain-containing protein [Betaproteobacteria bacterium]
MANSVTRFLRYVSATLALWGVLALGAAPLAHAQANKDETAVITVIQHQLEAFAADDAEQAFKYAAPSIKAMSGNAQNFMSLVKTRYGVVYRHANAAFLKPHIRGKAALVKVRLTDENGVTWMAAYTLELQKNKEWLISGCQLQGEQGTFV